MTDSVRVDIWGTCVSRDSFSLGTRGKDNTGFIISKYFSNCSFPIQFTKHELPDVSVADYESIFPHNASRKWACADLNKTIIETLDNSGSDWLIVDSRAMGYGIYRIDFGDGKHEFVTGDLTRIKTNFKPFDFPYSLIEVDVSDPEVMEGLTRFVKWVLSRYGRNVILVESVETFNRIGYDGNYCIDAVNRTLRNVKNQTFFNYFLYQNTGCWVVKAPSVMASDARHVWGYSPVHYVDEYYGYVLDTIKYIVNHNDDPNIWLKLNEMYNNASYLIAQVIYGDILTERNTLERAAEYAKIGRIDEAMTLLDEMEQRGVGLAPLYRGRIYRDGLGVDVDLNKAASCMRSAVDQDVWAAVVEFIDILWRISTPESYCEAIDCIEKYVARGHDGATGRLGRAYRDGKGVEKDLNKATEWMRKAADLKVNWAKNELYDVLVRINTPESNSEAFNVIKAFAETGDAGAMGRLGRAYRDGKGVEKDLNKATEWMRKATEKNVGWAKNELFDILVGINTPGSNSEAFDLIKKFAETGDAGAMGRLGRAYRDGKGVEKDLNKATEWMRKAADKNNNWSTELYDVVCLLMGKNQSLMPFYNNAADS